MSKFQAPRTRSFIAETDLSAKKYFGVKFGTDAEEVDLAGAGEGFGVLMNSPLVGETAEVAMNGGGAMVQSGAAYAKGAELACDAAGKFVAASSTNIVLGIAIDAAGGADEYREIERVFYVKA